MTNPAFTELIAAKSHIFDNTTIDGHGDSIAPDVELTINDGDSNLGLNFSG